MSDPRRARLAVEHLESRTVPTVITVTSTGDGIGYNGVVTLRQAIEAADSHQAVGGLAAPAKGPVTIKFDIPGSGVHVIEPHTPLPVLSGGVTIDATSQPGYKGPPLIELNGTDAGASSNGLVLLGGGNTVRGLLIDDFRLNGIVVASDGNLLAGDWIGVDSTGDRAAGNDAEGVVVVGSYNVIGGSKLADQMVISGNRLAGIDLTGSTVTDNLVEGDLIGTDAAGFAGVANGTGVLIQNGAHANTIGGTSVADRNTICGNITNQVEITGKGSSANVVEGNYIGIDSSGESAVQEGGDGVLISASATGNRIGGTASGAGNLIGGMGLWTFGQAGGAGVYLSGTGTSGNTIQGNWIGLDSRGVAALKDSGGGVIAVDVGYNTVGGSGSARNVIGDATNSPGLSRTDNILPVGWAFDSILYLEHPDLLGGSFRA